MFSFGGNTKQIIHLSLEHFPPAALVRMLVGDPPVRRWLHIDTGSDLTWILPPYGYEPQRSSTFSYRSCDGLLKSTYVTPSKTRGQCTYRQELEDKVVYEGTLGTETFAFETGDGESGILKNVVYGFGKTVGGRRVGSGTLGLNLGVLSITKSFGLKFSICLGNFNYIRREKHFLALGDDAIFGGWEVPLDTKDAAYRISLTSIIIEGENLGLENVLSKTKSIIDTGTSTISFGARSISGCRG
ncbi:unnamed protein product [Microthlaspi erraticum]|uniref:Peptidase A1 domain-containing protein n=1 Tax=Microthlaspi erraticum TaxID=1685480 RepID=A0A6D2LIE7_9BRAS|nr:unnamed protein product [Microthlaspi erraticum]